MGNDWKLTKLCSVASEVTVGFVGSMATEYTDVGVPFLRSKNVSPHSINDRDLKYISDEFHQKIRKSRLKPDDVVIVRTGTPGACAVIPPWLGEANCSDLVIVRCGPEISSRYLAYYVNTVARAHVNAHLVGAVQQHFNVSAAKSMAILLPPMEEQLKIVDILGALDDKIELNRQVNTTLESTARTLFQSWFVDFDPVIDNALAAGNPIPEPLQARAQVRAALGDQRRPLPDGLQEKFPDRFLLTDEMGWVPEGWAISTIGDQVEVTGGGTPSTKDSSFWEGGMHAFCTPKDMSTLPSMVLMDTERHVTELGVNKISSGQLQPGTVLMSSRAPIGYLAISDIPVSINQGIIAMLPSGKYGPLFLLCWAHFNMPQVMDRANGSTFLEISKKNFRPIPFLVPPTTVLSAFDTQASNIYRKTLLVSEQNVGLTKLRDTLLPKLLSGELRIPEAEQKMAEAI